MIRFYIVKAIDWTGVGFLVFLEMKNWLVACIGGRLIVAFAR